MINIWELLKNEGLVYNMPNEMCVKHVKHYPDDGVFRIITYSYDEIVSTHHASITDEEFLSRISRKPYNVVEYTRNSFTYSKIKEVFEEGSMPDSVGLVRHMLYSWAIKNIADVQCENCIHNSKCKAMELSDTEYPVSHPGDCGLFMDKEAFLSKQSEDIIKNHFINIVSNCSSYEQFKCQMQSYGISAVLLKSLEINCIVFIESKGRMSRTFNNFAHTYKTVEDAKQYMQSVKESKMAYMKTFGYPKTLTVTEDDNLISISCNSKYGIQSEVIRLINL
jgi:hypothetical protein